MKKVYIVTRYKREQHYHDEQLRSEEIKEIFDSEDKALKYIINKIKEDHWFLDEGYPNDPEIYKYNLNEDAIQDGMLVHSFVMDAKDHFKLISYRYKSYDVK